VGDLDSAAWWVPALLVGAGGLVAPAMYVLAGAATGHFELWRASVIPMMLLNFVVFFVLARPFARGAQRIANVAGWARG
jgi:cell shape-determining protein MreD